MRIWVDCTAAAHPLVLRPVIERLRERGHAVEITTREYELLLLFLHHPRRVLTREQILDRIWDTRDVDSNAIEVHIGRLRDKLEAHGEPRLIQTVRGAGYTLREDER